MIRIPYSAWAALFASLTPALFALPADHSQRLVVDHRLEIPGAELQPGTYDLSVEDRLRDRAIVRISAASGDKHYFVLAVPNAKLADDSSDGIVYFNARQESKKAVHAWKCPTCSAALEFVYPKLAAVKLTDETAQPVLAVDPAYDKLPANLSTDDMKVVTLWLLSPERITADNVGQGVRAAKYVGAASNSDVAAANSTTPAPGAKSEPAQMAGNVGQRQHLPKTAGNTYELLLAGLFAFSMGFLLRARRIHRES